MKRLLLLLTLLLIAPALTAAQEDTGWPIIERCVGEPTAPPDDWTYEGTILLHGWAGLHGVNANWETPHVLAFFDRQTFLAGAGAMLSPDGHWYAAIDGDINFSEDIMYSIGVVKINGIRILSTTDNTVINIPAKAEYTYRGGANATPFSKILWFDSEHVIYEGKKYNLSGEQADERDYWWVTSGEHISPDWQRMIYQLSDLPDWQIVDSEGSELGEPQRYWDAIWSPDSSQFVWSAYSSQATWSADILRLTDQDGNFIDTIFNLGSSNVVDGYLSTPQWSQDGTRLAFFVGPSYKKASLYIADLTTKQIIDTCLQAGTAAWSPDNLQLAVMAEGFDHRPVIVVDLQREQAYQVAYHSGYIIGWRAD